jgi:hypothetical protein
MNEKGKKQLFQSAVFTGIILAFFIVLSGMVFAGKRNWENGLRLAVEQVLPASGWQLGDMLPLKNNYSVSAACFKVSNIKAPSKKSYVLVMRIATYFGPLPAVFLFQDGKAEFQGIAYMNNSVAKEFSDNKFNRQIDYWTDTAALLVRDAIAGEEASK